MNVYSHSDIEVMMFLGLDVGGRLLPSHLVHLEIDPQRGRHSSRRVTRRLESHARKCGSIGSMNIHFYSSPPLQSVRNAISVVIQPLIFSTVMLVPPTSPSAIFGQIPLASLPSSNLFLLSLSSFHRILPLLPLPLNHLRDSNLDRKDLSS